MGGKQSQKENAKLKIFLESLFGRIDKTVSEKLEPIRKLLEERREYDFVVKHGLEGFRNKILKAHNEKLEFHPQAWLLLVLQKNPELRFPHRKILDFLSRQYDYEKKEFQEVNLSAIVRQCRLGKNKAAEYLRDLEEKELLRRREDGYRVWYKVS